MSFNKVTKPEHYIVQLDDSGAVDVVTLRTIESVVDSTTGGPVSDTTLIVPIVSFSNGGDMLTARTQLMTLRSLLDAAIARCSGQSGVSEPSTES
ncbi:hypothetical protein [Burkholderia anthina]|uniref:hypothetical protein n=1 Tax=Burkholderia anthina TaxID=179879 RepID=UPI00158C8CE9|nr:hypothetical protein [Burkholderia anthina]